MLTKTFIFLITTLIGSVSATESTTSSSNSIQNSSSPSSIINLLITNVIKKHPYLSFLSSLFILYFLYYRFIVSQKIKLYFVNNFRNNYLIKNCTLLHHRFMPTFWGFHGHSQTIINVFLRNNVVIPYKREYITLSDGGTINLDWVVMNKNPHVIESPTSSSNKNKNKNLSKRFSTNEIKATLNAIEEITESGLENDGFAESVKHAERKAPILLIFPGVTGSSAALEIKLFAECCRKNGIQAVVINYRGCNQKLTSAKIGIFSDDVKHAIDHIKAKYPDRLFLSAGFSFGANILCKYIGECALQNKPCNLDAAIAVSNPFCLLTSANAMTSFFSKNVYDGHFIKKRKNIVFSNIDIFKDVKSLDLERLEKATNSREFDDEFSVKIFNEGTSDQLYINHSCKNYVENISIPILFINALDDPISKRSAIPFQMFKKNPNIILATTERGGHVAFVDHLFPSSLDGQPKFSWMERACIQFVHVFCNFNASQGKSDSGNVTEASGDLKQN